MPIEIEIIKPQVFHVKYLVVNAKVRFWEDTSLNGVSDENGNIYGLMGDNWVLEIDVDTGKIVNWPEGDVASVWYKVCDAGEYTLLDSDRNTIVEMKNSYVPNCLDTSNAGYCDYISLEILPDGTIEYWNFDPQEWQEYQKDK